MNYYIQGSAARAEEIKAAFEKLGYDVRESIAFGAERLIMFTMPTDNKLRSCAINSDAAYFITRLAELGDYQELELPVQPKFKDGDKVVFGTLHETIAVVLRNEKRYLCESCREILFKEQDRWHLASKPHYDISNFKPFDKVLVRDYEDGVWNVDLFGFYRAENKYHFRCNSNSWCMCIPFEGNEHMLGTADMPSEEYINW